ncbi:MAG: TIGR03086 family metal-binding protein [Ilumatobacteraceae bacterium]
MSTEVIDRLTHLVNEFDARVQAAPADSWSNPAPCEGWTATDVVAHISRNFNGMAAALTGTQPGEFDAADPVGSWTAARDRMLGAATTGDLSTPVPGPAGPMPAEQMIGRFMCMDVLVHTWDLARAVGGDERLDQDAVERGYSGLKPMDAMIRQPGVFGPKIEPAEGDDLQTEFLKFLGRAV